MKRLSFYLAVFAALLFVVSGCSRPALKAVPNDEALQPAMWQVSHADSSLYLLGSFHMLPRGVPWYNETIAAAFDGADVLLIESRDSANDLTEVRQLIAEKSRLPDDKTLDAFIDAENYARVIQHAAALGLDENRIARSQPWFIMILFAYEGLDQSGVRKHYGVDYHFESNAQKRRIPVYGLETMSEAFDALANQPMAVQVERLLSSLSPEQGSGTTLMDLFTAWAVGDVDGLERLMRADMSDAEYRVLLTERNKRWMPRLEQQLQQPQQAMVVVGAAHLVGKDSLVDLLQRRGYSIRRVQ
jgi:uncharacterized protein YbaP (TraB family)